MLLRNVSLSPELFSVTLLSNTILLTDTDIVMPNPLNTQILQISALALLFVTFNLTTTEEANRYAT
jgi:hypothetical protein